MLSIYNIQKNFVDTALNSKMLPKLYPSHIPTTTVQKSLLAVGSAFAALLNPQRGDMVACMGETTAGLALPRIYRKMVDDPVGRQILNEKPRIRNETVNFDQLRKLNDGTLGREYMRFLDKLVTTPNARPRVHFVDDLELAYVIQRYRETHDLYHIILEMPTNILGEVTVKWFEGIQLGLPMCILGGLFGALRLYPKQRQKYLLSHLPWVIRNATNGKLLMNVYWEKHWDQSLTEIRKELNIEDPPS